MNCVVLGYVDIDMVVDVFEEVFKGIIVIILVGCLGKLEEIVYCVKFLVVDELVFIIGLMLIVNGV